MFENIIGNEKNKNSILKLIENNKISHSYIFWGINGIGKKLIAQDFAKKILCLNKDINSCKCKSCIEFDSNNNPDFKQIESIDGKIKIEQIREMQKRIAEKPIISNKKFYIIDNADTMTKEAQNCLLKTLEEPPEYITIILICQNEDNLLTTIKSRCTRMNFEPIDRKEMIQFLSQNGEQNIDGEIVELSQGSIGKYLELNKNLQLYENIKTIFTKMQEKNLLDIIQMSEEIYKSKEEINFILEYINVLLLKLSKQNIRYIKCIKIVEETKKRLKVNSNYDMCIDNMLFNIWREINEKNNRSKI